MQLFIFVRNNEILREISPTKRKGFFVEYENNQKKLQELEVEWGQAAEQLEAIK